ncbi:MAG TPA: undecaprenyl-diphosphate phosphatase [bacterium]|nr:undecaprenyl-diphosphate phosphatase [bacterium]HQI05091.1 undecaprenyl-diphosphate phosphatase [bacterium]HQO91399.1 undecaprenyl-diphosphate phosphatase [bacterium]
MTILESIILGLLQGFTEFLPVSSSGHLALTENLMGHKDVPLIYDILLHVASLMAVMIFFRRKIADLFNGMTNFKEYNAQHKYLVLLIISTVITGGMVFITKPLLLIMRDRPVFLSGAFLFTAIMLFTAQFFLKKRFEKKEITWIDAVFIGFFQGIAVLPGVSRSGSTITAALLRKINSEDAVEYSFMLAIPAILGALVLESAKGSFSAIDPVVALSGFAASFLASMIALKFLVFMIRRTVLYPFALYLVLLSLSVIFIY